MASGVERQKVCAEKKEMGGAVLLHLEAEEIPVFRLFRFAFRESISLWRL
jgi:hypothetical protein